MHREWSKRDFLRDLTRWVSLQLADALNIGGNSSIDSIDRRTTQHFE